MSLYELPISASADELLALAFGEHVEVVGVWTTVAGGVAVPWRLRLFPGTVVEPLESVVIALAHAYPDKGISISGQAFAQLYDEEEGFGELPVEDDDKYFDVSSEEWYCAEPLDVALEPGATFKARLLLHIASSHATGMSPLLFVKAKQVDHSVMESCWIAERLCVAGLGGDAELCDSRVCCTDGEFRANAAVLRVTSAYFRDLFRFKASAGDLGLDVDFVKPGYTVAVASAALQHLQAGTVQDLTDWSMEDLCKLIELGSQVNPDAVDFLKAVVEESLLGHLGSDSELSGLAAFARLHELHILANAVDVRLASDPAFRAKFRDNVDEQTWTRVDQIIYTRLNGISYRL